MSQDAVVRDPRDAPHRDDSRRRELARERRLRHARGRRSEPGGQLGDCGGSDGPESEVNGCAIQPATQCPGADLSGANLEGADLSGANLSGANLEGTNLGGANLSEANLSSAQIVDTDLSDADLTGANLTGATITGTNLEGATLCGTIRADGTTDDTSCPPSAETTETTDTTSTAAAVTSFDVADVDCSSGAGTGTVTVSWTTEATTAVELSVDGAIASTAGPEGTADLDVPCDGATHEVSITPRNDSGRERRSPRRCLPASRPTIGGALHAETTMRP